MIISKNEENYCWSGKCIIFAVCFLTTRYFSKSILVYPATFQLFDFYFCVCMPGGTLGGKRKFVCKLLHLPVILYVCSNAINAVEHRNRRWGRVEREKEREREKKINLDLCWTHPPLPFWKLHEEHYMLFFPFQTSFFSPACPVPFPGPEEATVSEKRQGARFRPFSLSHQLSETGKEPGWILKPVSWLQSQC